MPEFKLVLSDPESGKSAQLTVSGQQAQMLIGLKIGDVIDGSALGYSGKKIKITGGTDRSGIPMRPDLPGGGKRYVLLASPPGYKPKKKGERKRKLVRGSSITEDIVQVNAVLIKEDG